MSTKTLNKDWELLDELQKVADDYGVKKAIVFPYSQLIEIDYHEIGQGSILSELITDKLDKIAPDRSYRIKMIPTDKNLIVELL